MSKELGFAMVHSLLQQTRGELEIESDVGRGATERMVLPVVNDVAVPSRPPGELAEPLLEARGQGELILLVEDSEDVLALAREQLLPPGSRVVAASTPTRP